MTYWNILFLWDNLNCDKLPKPACFDTKLLQASTKMSDEDIFEYDSSEEDDSDFITQHEEGKFENYCKEEIRNLVYHYTDNYDELPWRLFQGRNDDEFLLWSAASRLVWKGPNYSDELTEDNQIIINEEAGYYTLPKPSLSQTKAKLQHYMTIQEFNDFENDLQHGVDVGMVGFVKKILTICEVDTSEYNVYLFMSELDYSNLL